MPRPLETYLSMRETRITRKYAVCETEQAIRTRMAQRKEPVLSRSLSSSVFYISGRSLEYFRGVNSSMIMAATLVQEGEAVPTRSSRSFMSRFLSDVYKDGRIIRKFAQTALKVASREREQLLQWYASSEYLYNLDNIDFAAKEAREAQANSRMAASVIGCELNLRGAEGTEQNSNAGQNRQNIYERLSTTSHMDLGDGIIFFDQQ